MSEGIDLVLWGAGELVCVVFRVPLFMFQVNR